MDLGPGADASLLQRALEGEAVGDDDTRALVGVADAVRGLERSGLAPGADFVASLRDRLLDESAEIATGPESSDREESQRTAVLRLPDRTLRAVAAVAASFVLLATVVGIASRSAVPGDVLFPVKQLLDRAAVALSGSRLDEGRTHLAQAQQHISEARDVLDRGEVDPGDLSVALDAASASVASANSILTDVYLTEGRPEALTELADFLTRARPQVDAMDARVPEAARPAYERLRALLAEAELDALRRVAGCAECGSAALRAEAALATLRPTMSPTTPPTASSDPSASPGLPLPGATVAVPSVEVTTDGLAVDGGGVTLPGATLDLPSLGVTSTGAVLDGGGATLPGATLPLPSVSLGAPTVEPTEIPTLPLTTP